MAQQTVSTSNLDSRKVPEAADSWISGAKYLGILLALLAIGFFGHQTHWSFGFTKRTTADIHHVSSGTTSTSNVEAESDSWEVKFPSEKSLTRSGIKTSLIEQQPMRKVLRTTGVVTYDQRLSASLSARVSGTVWRVEKQAGEAVRRGDVLVIIDAAEVGKAKAEFFSDLVAVESKSEILSMLEKVTGAVPERQVREARVAVREARIRLQNTEQTLINLGLRLRKEAFEKLNDAERAAKLQFLGLPESIVKDLDPAYTTSNLLPLTASFDGVLLHHDAALGEMVEAGKPVLEIADLRHMWLTLDVPKEDASRLALGQRVRFSPDGVEQELDSTITWISTEMNQHTRTLQIRAEVDNPVVSANTVGQEVRLLRANTFGTGTISLGETSAAFVVPTSAVLHADNQPMVFVKVGDLAFARVDVKLGVTENGLIQIESEDLKPGLEVVSRGSHILKSEWILNHVAAASP